MSKLRLAIDNQACWGCRACEVACKQENRAPEGLRLIKVLEDGPRLSGGKPEFRFRVQTCRHCDDPPCVEICPEAAILIREYGIVVMDDSQCSGCGLCVDECPYGAIEFDSEEGVARKCNLCFHRVVSGLIPACGDNVCLAHGIYFGDPEVIEKQMTQQHTYRRP